MRLRRHSHISTGESLTLTERYRCCTHQHHASRTHPATVWIGHPQRRGSLRCGGRRRGGGRRGGGRRGGGRRRGRRRRGRRQRGRRRGGRGMRDAHRPPTWRLGHRNDSQPCDPTPPAWQAPTRVMPVTSSGPAVVSPATMRADTAPNHPIRVTAHPGWAHAGRRRAGWAKGARSWRTPRGQGRRRGLPLRLSAAWRARWHDGCCRPDRSVQHPRRVQGGRKGNHFAAWQEPNLFTEEIRAAFRSLR